MSTKTRADSPLEHLRRLVESAADPGISESVRGAQARTVAEYWADLRDMAKAAGVISGSRALDVLAGRTDGAHAVLGELRAINLISDTPGVDPRVLAGVAGATSGLGQLPLIRQVAEAADFTGQGSAPVVPAVATGTGVNGGAVDPALPVSPAGVITIADAGAASSRHLAGVVADIASQVKDFTTPAGRALIDRILTDVVDLAAEEFVGAALVSGAGGTRSGATDLGGALDEAEAAAGAAVGAAAGLLVVNPADWPLVRRTQAPTWQAGGPRPAVAVTPGVVAGTAIVTDPSALHLFADAVDFAIQTVPSRFGELVAVTRPFYLAIRVAVGVQTVTAIPA